MKTNYKDMAKRYKAAYEQILAARGDWYREEFAETVKTGREDRIYNIFIDEVVILAESTASLETIKKPKKEKKTKPVFQETGDDDPALN